MNLIEMESIWFYRIYSKPFSWIFSPDLSSLTVHSTVKAMQVNLKSGITATGKTSREKTARTPVKLVLCLEEEDNTKPRS